MASPAQTLVGEGHGLSSVRGQRGPSPAQRQPQVPVRPQHTALVRRHPAPPPRDAPHTHAPGYLSAVPTGDPSPQAQARLQGWGRAATSSGCSLLSTRRSCICLWMSSCSPRICSCSSLITFRTDCRKEERGEKGAQHSGSPRTRGRAGGRSAGRPAVTAPSRALRRNQKTGVFRACATRSSGLACNRNSPPAAPLSHTPLDRPCTWASGAQSPATAEPGPHPDASLLQTPVCTRHLPPQTPVAHAQGHTHARYCGPNPKLSLTPHAKPDSLVPSRAFWP